MALFREMKIYSTWRNAGDDTTLTIKAASKEDVTQSFLLRGKSKILLFDSRLGVGSCVNIETLRDGVTVSRMCRAIDTIESYD